MSNELAALEARISKIEAYQDICNLQAQYAYLVDFDQVDRLGEIFAEEFAWEVEFKKAFQITSITELIEYVSSTRVGNIMTRHQMLSPYIEIDGDKAKGTWFMFGPGTSDTPEGQVANWTAGSYHNEYVRENGVWKISLFKFKYNFRTPYDEGWVKTPVIQEAWSRR